MDCKQLLIYQQRSQQKQALDYFGSENLQSNETPEYSLSRLCQNKMSQSYCQHCYSKKINPYVQRLQQVNTYLNELKQRMEKKLQAYQQQQLRIKQKEEYLKLLKREKEQLNYDIILRSQYYEHSTKQLSARHSQKQGLQNLFAELQEQTIITESELMSKRSQLRILQAKRIIKAYDLYKIGKAYMDFSISDFLVCYTIKDVVVAENDDENQSSEKTICKINFKVQHFNEYSLEHRLIINYSVQNLIKFIEYVIRIKDFEVPFPFSQDLHNLPSLQIPSLVDTFTNITKTDMKYSMEEIELFNENPIPLYDNFIYCWINYFILYKRLGINFQENVLDKKLIFPVQQLKEFFENELQSLPQQLSTIEYDSIIYETQLISSDLLKIKYHPKSLENNSEEIILCRNDPNLQIIQISQIYDLQNYSRLSDSSHDNNLLDNSFEFIQKNISLH